MKNLKYLVLALAIVPFFASCEEDPATVSMGGATITLPEAAITAAEGVLSAPIAVTVAAENAEAVIESISVKAFVADAEEGTAIAAKSDFTLADGVYTLTITSATIGDEIIDNLTKIEVVAVVTDGDTSSKSINIESTAREYLAIVEGGFAWVRDSGRDGTGLDKFGLAWTQNQGSAAPFYAIVKKEGTTKLVVLEADDWAAINTVGALKAAVDGATGVEDYRGIEVGKNIDNYDVVLAVNVGVEYYIIHITSSKTTGAPGSYAYTIAGDYKTKAVLED